MDYQIIAIALAFNAVDFLTGLISAIKNECVKSSKMRDGLFKKVGFVCCYALAWLLDCYGSTVGINVGVSVLPAIVTYTVITECVSICENIAKINMDLVPDKILSLLNIKKGE